MAAIRNRANWLSNSLFTLLLLNAINANRAEIRSMYSNEFINQNLNTNERLTRTNKFIDLSHTFNKETNHWPGRRSTFEIENESVSEDGVWIASKRFCTSEHTATHIDAPYHFDKNGRTLDQIPLEDFIDLPGVMIDIYDKVHSMNNKNELRVNADYGLTVNDILDWERRNGQIPDRAIVLLRTGWGSRWHDRQAFLGTNETDDLSKPPVVRVDAQLHFPGYSPEAAMFLSTQRRIVGVGTDAVSADVGINSRLFPAHQNFQKHNVYIIEMVANLHLLPARGFNVWAVPFKIDKGTGAPIRVLARKNF